jgi:hypothetical protein
MKRLLLLGLVATIAIGTATGFAATLNVGSHHLWAGSQTLTKGTCTLSGTGQSVDTYVNQGSSGTSYGTSTTLSTQPDSGSRKYAYILFDLSKCSPAIPTTGGADSATLTLRITSSAFFGARTLTLTPVTSSWSGSTTWNSQPSVDGSATTTFSSGRSANTVDVPVTIDVDAFIKGQTNYGWRISDNGGSGFLDTVSIASSNASSNKPTLTIDYEK